MLQLLRWVVFQPLQLLRFQAALRLLALIRMLLVVVVNWIKLFRLFASF
jgi:hypothetical protein